MIDIHCHILPGIDDGAANLEDSLKMAKQAVSDGITKIIATPHHKNGKYENVKHDILSQVAELNRVFASENIQLTILPGQEVRIFGELLQQYKEDQILTLNNTGKYIFIEFPSNHVPRYTEKILYDIQLNGIKPVIVHPERNQEIIENPNLLYQFVKKGAFTQVTASSITGRFGKKIKKFSLDLIEANLTHFVASDAHNTTGRGFKMSEAYHVIEKEFGIDYVYLFRENAEDLVTGKAIFKEEPLRVKKKIFGLF